jgi:hypothetical protein
LPITEEYRIFVCNGKVISKEFYWESYIDDVKELSKEQPNVNNIPQEFIQGIIDRVGKSINFFVVDVAKTQAGKWIIIEFNDGQMSGLSGNDPFILYENLSKAIIKMEV